MSYHRSEYSQSSGLEIQSLSDEEVHQIKQQKMKNEMMIQVPQVKNQIGNQPIQKESISTITTLDFNMFKATRGQIKKQDSMMISSPNKDLNNLLGGGLHYGMISQIYGESGSGKSQLAMLFVIGAIQRNQIGAYIATDKDISEKRFLEIAYSVMNQAEYEEQQDLLTMKKITDYNGCMNEIEKIMGQIKNSKRGGVLVIDSVFSLINYCFSANNIEKDNLERSKKQAQFVNRLRMFAKMSNCAVLLINHATDSFQKRKSLHGKNYVPALGPSWELNLDESIEVLKKGDMREICVINSPKAVSNCRAWFSIVSDGIVWVATQGIQTG